MYYEDGILKRILFEGGYYADGDYHFYLQNHLGDNNVVADKQGKVVQSNNYYPFGLSFADGSNPGKQPYKYSNKELDSDIGLNIYDSHARLYDPQVPRFLSMDPLAEKKPHISPYAYCLNNPLKFIDPDGRDEFVFDGKHNNYAFHKRITKEGVHTGSVRGTDITFTFADPVNDPESIEKGHIANLYFPSDKELNKDLVRGGVNDENKDIALLYLATHSNASLGEGELDFTVKSEIHGTIGLDASTLYVRKDNKGNNVGHNNSNFGNYMWGAAAKGLGVRKITALLSAHLNNLVTDPENRDVPAWHFYKRKLDSLDDQYSIHLGWEWKNQESK